MKDRGQAFSSSSSMDTLQYTTSTTTAAATSITTTHDKKAVDDSTTTTTNNNNNTNNHNNDAIVLLGGGGETQASQGTVLTDTSDNDIVLAMVHEFVVQRPNNDDETNKDDEDDSEDDDDDDDDPDRYEVEQGENWLRLIEKEGNSVLDDTQDTFGTYASQVYPSMLSLASVGVLDNVPSKDCYICVDLDGESLAIKDMRKPLSTVATTATNTVAVASTPSKSAHADGDKNTTSSPPVIGIVRKGKGWEVLPRRQLRILWPGDRLCTNLCHGEPDGLILQYRFSANSRKRSRGDSMERSSSPILNMSTQPEADSVVGSTSPGLQTQESNKSTPKKKQPPQGSSIVLLNEDEDDDEDNSNDNNNNSRSGEKPPQTNDDDDDDANSVATEDSDKTELMETQMETQLNGLLEPPTKDEKKNNNNKDSNLEVIKEGDNDDDDGDGGNASEDSDTTDVMATETSQQQHQVKVDTSNMMLCTQPLDDDDGSDDETTLGEGDKKEEKDAKTPMQKQDGIIFSKDSKEKEAENNDDSSATDVEDNSPAKAKPAKQPDQIISSNGKLPESAKESKNGDKDSTSDAAVDEDEKLDAKEEISSQQKKIVSDGDNDPASANSKNNDHSNKKSDKKADPQDDKDANAKTKPPEKKEVEEANKVDTGINKLTLSPARESAQHNTGTDAKGTSKTSSIGSQNSKQPQEGLILSPGLCMETQDPPGIIPEQETQGGKTEASSEATVIISDSFLRDTGEETEVKAPAFDKETKSQDGVMNGKKSATSPADQDGPLKESATASIQLTKSNNDAPSSSSLLTNRKEATVEEATSANVVDDGDDGSETQIGMVDPPANNDNDVRGEQTGISPVDKENDASKDKAGTSKENDKDSIAKANSQSTKEAETLTKEDCTPVSKRKKSEKSEVESVSPPTTATRQSGRKRVRKETPSNVSAVTPRTSRKRASAEKEPAKEPVSKRKRSRAAPAVEDAKPGAPEIRVLTTGIELSNAQKHMINRIGGQLIEKAADANMATHVIAGSKGTPMRRTPKLMIGLCTTSNIVNLDWLIHSAKERKPLPTKDFLLVDNEEAEVLYNFNMRETLMRAGRMRSDGKSLLGQYCIYICPGVAGSRSPNNRTPPLEEFRLIVEAAGASWVKTLPKKSSPSLSRTVILVSKVEKEATKQSSTKKVAEALQNGAICKSTEELFHAIMTQQFDFA